MSAELRKRWAQAGGAFPENWEVVPLETLLRDSKGIAVGVMYPGPNTPGGVPLIKVGDVNGGLVPLRPSYCISAEVNAEYERTQLAGDELLITLVGNPGECVVVKQQMAGWNAARAIAVIRLEDPSLRVYLKTVLESTACRHLIDAVLNTTVQKTLNLKDIRLLPIPMPPKQVIQAISGFSNALNDRIALLCETNATLEAIAQTTFKSWFVDFDPVQAKSEGLEPEGMDAGTAALFPDRFEESELGFLPKGWEVRPVGELVEGIYDGPHATPAESESGPIFLGIKNLTGTHLELANIRHISEDDWSKWTRRVEPTHGDIVFSYEATLGFFAVIPPEVRCCLGRRLALIRPHTENGAGLFWFHQFISTPFQQMLDKHTIHGATVNRIALKAFPSYSVLNPSEALKLAFNDLVEPLWTTIHNNQAQLNTLTQLRDTLLPRLISGRLSLPEEKDSIKNMLSEAI